MYGPVASGVMDVEAMTDGSSKSVESSRSLMFDPVATLKKVDPIKSAKLALTFCFNFNSTVSCFEIVNDFTRLVVSLALKPTVAAVSGTLNAGVLAVS